ncbi:glycine cleavage system protein R [Dongshaea marina]|uniref:glycine cleavage system protein R n=1 Tax=Dongshaea marina TaxID=2047966 RepID=UPI000D3E3256|nr:ACT domain-containing protein [Dongshaea marina]
MKKQFIMTLMGPETPGLMRILAEKTHARQGIWLKSKISHLEGQCAGIIKIETDEQQVEALQQELKAVAGLQVVYPVAEDSAPSQSKELQLTIESRDRPGLIKDISNIFDGYDVSVTNLECHRFAVAEIGQSVFKGDFDLMTPADIDLDSLVAELEELDLRVIKNTVDG